MDACTFGWVNALQESLLDGSLGFVCLERVYLENKSVLDPGVVEQNCHPFKP